MKKKRGEGSWGQKGMEEIRSRFPYQVRSYPAYGLLTILFCRWDKAHTSWSGPYVPLQVLFSLSSTDCIPAKHTAGRKGIWPALSLPPQTSNVGSGASFQVNFVLSPPK